MYFLGNSYEDMDRSPWLEQLSLPVGPAPTKSLLTVFKDVLYFIAYDDVRASALWRTDGTEAGTVIFLDLIEAGKRTAPSKVQRPLSAYRGVISIQVG